VDQSSGVPKSIFVVATTKLYCNRGKIINVDMMQGSREGKHYIQMLGISEI
jgi:hypothetical protein